MRREIAQAGQVGHLHLRDLTSTDAPVCVRLMAVLGYPTAPDAARQRIEAILLDPDYRTFVAGSLVSLYANECRDLVYCLATRRGD